MKIKKVYLGRRQIYPDGWSPGENTILYMPFHDDLLDHSNNNIQFTNTNTVLENNTAYFNGSANLINRTFTNYLNSAPFTCSVRVKSKTFHNDTGIVSGLKGSYSSRNGWSIFQMSHSGNTYRAEMSGGGSASRQIFTPLNLNEWDLLTYVKTPTELLFYKNGTLIGTQTSPTGTFQTELSIGQNRGNTSNQSEWIYFNGWMSELIIENKARTDQEVTNYYEKTKGNYGL